ncbi:M48 family metalloprotease [Rhodococcus sp. AQ5-07]|uniref:M48 family metalloprotease n=1 Tax=Rhodococcus sp. AQ5-07 TaxID=2054902 RepID=UPI000DBFE316|nr:M48 family metalloprotease [Rhodococcus sp. AQ5-07]RAL31022.1 hypothetical protein CVN56_30035 [Rhodococcus sp. AQ5-07]
MDSGELIRRKTVCAETMDRISSSTDSVHSVPTLKFVKKSGRCGFYNRKKNEVSIREKDFLSEPSTSDGVVEAVVVYELGHWADPKFDTRCRRSSVAILMSVMPAGLVALGFLVVKLFGGSDLFSLLATVAVMLGVLALHVVVPFFSWSSEYEADRFAASIMDKGSVVEFLESLVGQRLPRPSHPSPASRAARVRSS